MTRTEGKLTSAAVKDILLSNPDGLHEAIRAVMQEVLEAEMDELGASKSERTPERLGFRSGYYGRTLSRGSASLSCGFRKTAPGASPPNCSSATSVPSAPWWRRWPRCRCRACRPGRSRRSRRSCAAMPSPPHRPRPSTSGWTRARRPLPSGRFWPIHAIWRQSDRQSAALAAFLEDLFAASAELTGRRAPP